METYLVGGAVRDQLLGVPVTERDWVVVGATPEQMARQGYQPVGKDFPVFLHPDNKEEYALARTERKRGHGYGGFEFNTSTDTTLEQDLWRRDLTINAMARDQQGNIIDPHGGRQDLQERLLRHVSPAFVEDPLRVLRVARFAARLAPLGFTVAAETQALLRQISASGELNYLVPERVWRETERALAESQPAVYFETLQTCSALASVMPELDRLFGVPQQAEQHPEIDSGRHSLMVLTQATSLSAKTTVRFAALVHDLGKGDTPPAQWPHHPGHDERGLPMIAAMVQRLRLPQAHGDLARLCCQLHGQVHSVFRSDPEQLLKLLETADALRRPERFEDLLLCCEADSRGRQGFEQSPYPQAAWLRLARTAVASVDHRALMAAGFKGKQLGQEIRRRRLEALQRLPRPAEISQRRETP